MRAGERVHRQISCLRDEAIEAMAIRGFAVLRKHASDALALDLEAQNQRKSLAAAERHRVTFLRGFAILPPPLRVSEPPAPISLVSGHYEVKRYLGREWVVPQ